MKNLPSPIASSVAREVHDGISTTVDRSGDASNISCHLLVSCTRRVMYPSAITRVVSGQYAYFSRHRGKDGQESPRFWCTKTRKHDFPLFLVHVACVDYDNKLSESESVNLVTTHRQPMSVLVQLEGGLMPFSPCSWGIGIQPSDRCAVALSDRISRERHPGTGLV